MTVPNIVPVNTYSGNGSTTTFDFDFLVEENSQLIVQTVDEFGAVKDLTVDIDYSINELKNPNGSFITFPLPSSSHSVLSDKEKIVLSLTLPIEQDKEYKNSSKLNLSTLEYSFDYAIRILQILSRAIERCIKVQEGSDILPDDLVKSLFNAEANAKQSETNAKASEVATEQLKQDTQAIADKALQDIGTAKTDAIDTINSEETSAIQAVNTAENSAISNIQTEGGKYVQEAKDWAIKMDGKVNGEDYSSKYYADQAKILTAGSLNQKQITNCILAAPNGVVTYSSNTISIKQGLKVLIPNERNADKTLKNIELTLDADISRSGTELKGVTGELLIASDKTLSVNKYLEGYVLPSNFTGVFRNLDENTCLFYLDGTAKTERSYANIGKASINSEGNITSLITYQPVSLVKEQDIDGMWVNKNYEICKEVQFGAESQKQYDLSSYLPADGNVYEVIVSIFAQTGTTNGNSFAYGVTTTLANFVRLCANITRTTNFALGAGSAIIPVSADRKITLQQGNTDSGTSTVKFLNARAYRKVR